MRSAAWSALSLLAEVDWPYWTWWIRAVLGAFTLFIAIQLQLGRRRNGPLLTAFTAYFWPNWIALEWYVVLGTPWDLWPETSRLMRRASMIVWIPYLAGALVLSRTVWRLRQRRTGPGDRATTNGGSGAHFSTSVG